MNKKKVLFGIAFALLIIFAFTIRFFPLRLFHWWDETVYLQHAEIFFSGRTNYSELSFRPPLLSIIFAGAYLFWHSSISASIAAALLSVLAPIFVFFIGKKLYGIYTGALAGFLLAFSPAVISNSNFLMTDVPAMSLLAISFFCLLYRENRGMLFLSGAFFSLAVLMKFTSVLFGLVLLAYVFSEKISLKRISFIIFGVFIIIFPYLLWAQISFGNFLHPFILGSFMVTDLNEGTWFYFSEFGRAFTFLSIVGLGLWILSAFFSIVYKKKYEFLKIDALLFLWMLVFLIYLTYTPHKEIRYIFPIGVPAAILAARGLLSFLSLFNKKYNKLLFFIILGYLLFLGFAPFQEKLKTSPLINTEMSDEISASHYLINSLNYTGLVYTHHNWPVIAYYSGLETKSLWPNTEDFYNERENLLTEPGIIIVTTEVAKHPTPEWLNNHTEFTFLKRFGYTYVYSYNLNGTRAFY